MQHALAGTSGVVTAERDQAVVVLDVAKQMIARLADEVRLGRIKRRYRRGICSENQPILTIVLVVSKVNLRLNRLRRPHDLAGSVQIDTAAQSASVDNVGLVGPVVCSEDITWNHRL